MNRRGFFTSLIGAPIAAKASIAEPRITSMGAPVLTPVISATSPLLLNAIEQSTRKPIIFELDAKELARALAEEITAEQARLLKLKALAVW
jgi:hypothetical protein